MKTTIYSLFILLILFTISCNKKEVIQYDGNQFTIEVQQIEERYKITWPKIKSSDFIRYEVIRSNEPIPNPKPNASNNSVRIFTTNDFDVLTFTDSLNSVSAKSYYRVFAVLKNRTITSNEVNFVSNNITIDGQYGIIKRNNNLVYFNNNNTGFLNIFNLTNNEVKETFLNTSGSSYYLDEMVFGNYNGVGCCFIPKNSGSSISSVDIFNAETMQYVHSITTPNISYYYGIEVKGNDLYAFNYSNSTIVRLDINTGTIEKSYPVNQGSSDSKLLFSKNKNKLMFCNYYYSINYNVDANGDLTTVDSIYSSSGINMQPSLITSSSNGNYYATSTNGNIINDQYTSVGTLFSNTSYRQFYFTDDDKYVMGLQVNGQNIDVSIFNLNGLSLHKKISVKNANFFSSIANFYLDGNQLFIFFNSFDSLTGQSIIIIKKIEVNL